MSVIPCPACTYDNEPTRKSCEICGQPLPSLGAGSGAGVNRGAAGGGPQGSQQGAGAGGKQTQPIPLADEYFQDAQDDELIQAIQGTGGWADDVGAGGGSGGSGVGGGPAAGPALAGGRSVNDTASRTVQPKSEVGVSKEDQQEVMTLYMGLTNEARTNGITPATAFDDPRLIPPTIPRPVSEGDEASAIDSSNPNSSNNSSSDEKQRQDYKSMWDVNQAKLWNCLNPQCQGQNSVVTGICHHCGFHRNKSNMPRYTAARIIFDRLRDPAESVAQLNFVQFIRANGNAVEIASVDNPGGKCHPDHGPHSLLMDQRLVKWADLNYGVNGSSEIRFQFRNVYFLTKYQMWFAPDHPGRDPVSWRLEAFCKDTGQWDLLDRRIDFPVSQIRGSLRAVPATTGPLWFNMGEYPVYPDDPRVSEEELQRISAPITPENILLWLDATFIPEIALCGKQEISLTPSKLTGPNPSLGATNPNASSGSSGSSGGSSSSSLYMAQSSSTSSSASPEPSYRYKLAFWPDRARGFMCETSPHRAVWVRPNALNGLPVVDFDRSYLPSSVMLANATHGMMISMVIRAATVKRYMTVFARRENGLPRNPHFCVDSQSRWEFGGSGIAVAKHEDSVVGSWQIVTIMHGKRGVQIYVNGVRRGYHREHRFVSQPHDEFTLFHAHTPPSNQGVAGTDNAFDGSVAEMIVYGREMDDPGRKQVEAYLKNKWKVYPARYVPPVAHHLLAATVKGAAGALPVNVLTGTELSFPAESIKSSSDSSSSSSTSSPPIPTSQPLTSLVCTWEVVNTSASTWPSTTSLEFVGGYVDVLEWTRLIPYSQITSSSSSSSFDPSYSDSDERKAGMGSANRDKPSPSASDGSIGIGAVVIRSKLKAEYVAPVDPSSPQYYMTSYYRLSVPGTLKEPFGPLLWVEWPVTEAFYKKNSNALARIAYSLPRPSRLSVKYNIPAPLTPSSPSSATPPPPDVTFWQSFFASTITELTRQPILSTSLMRPVEATLDSLRISPALPLFHLSLGGLPPCLFNDMGFPSVPMLGIYANPYYHFPVPIVVKAPLFPPALKAHRDESKLGDRPTPEDPHSRLFPAALQTVLEAEVAQGANIELYFLIHTTSKIIGQDNKGKTTLTNVHFQVKRLQLFFHPWFVPYFPLKQLDEQFPASVGVFSLRGFSSSIEASHPLAVDGVATQIIHPHCDVASLDVCYSPDNMHIPPLALTESGAPIAISTFWSLCSVDDQGNLARLSQQSLGTGRRVAVTFHLCVSDEELSKLTVCSAARSNTLGELFENLPSPMLAFIPNPLRAYLSTLSFGPPPLPVPNY